MIISYTPCRDTAISPRCGISLSYTPCRDTAISPRCGISLSFTHVALMPMLSHTPNYSQQQQQHSSINYICLPLYLEQQTIQMLNNHQKCLNK